MLLFDETISSRVAEILEDAFPGARHVRDFQLLEASDEIIWDTAAQHDLAVVSKDDDFLSRALVRGHPPKVVLLKVGNVSTRELVTFLRSRREAIHNFLAERDDAVLVLSR